MESTKKAIVAALAIIAIIAIYLLYIASTLNIILRAVSAIAVLILVGLAIQNLLKLKGWYGFYMIGSRNGLATIDNISKRYKGFWDFMAMWGLTLGFGLLAYPLLKGKIDKRAYATGILSLAIILFFVLPYLSYGFQFINIAPIQNAIANQPSTHGPSIIYYVTIAISIAGGFSGSILFSLFANTESILYSFVLFITNPSLGTTGSGIATQVPGVAPIIPGIDIPLVPGIISLAILLIVHEFSHGILARKAKVPLESIGILVFGFIPVGGYVEPNENAIKKLDSIKQTKIFSAGISANFIAMIILLIPMIAILYFATPIYEYKVFVSSTTPNYPASGILKSGMQILKWNNYTINSISNLTAAGKSDKPNGTVSILTNTGLYKFKAVADPNNSSMGLIGVSLRLQSEPVLNTIYEKIIYFLYTVFALSVLLNFLVAVVNLLPLPGLDGWRIYETNIKNGRFIRFLGALIIILLLLNILPWIFYI